MIVMITTLFSLFLVNTAQAANVGSPIPRPRVSFINPLHISRGFIVGNVETIRQQGLAVWRFRYEGTMFHGIGSMKGPLIDNGCAAARDQMTGSSRSAARNKDRRDAKANDDECIIETNPFPFSFFANDVYDEYRALAPGMMVVYFEIPTIAPSSLFSDTRNFVRHFWPINTQLEIAPSAEADGVALSRRLTRESGVVRGLVIRATVEDIFFKTYEIVVQSVEQGHSFKALSVNDPQLFDYIVDSMFAGKTLALEYVRIIPGGGVFSNLRGYWTHFRVIRAEVAE